MDPVRRRRDQGPARVADGNAPAGEDAGRKRLSHGMAAARPPRPVRRSHGGPGERRGRSRPASLSAARTARRRRSGGSSTGSHAAGAERMHGPRPPAADQRRARVVSRKAASTSAVWSICGFALRTDSCSSVSCLPFSVTGGAVLFHQALRARQRRYRRQSQLPRTSRSPAA